MPIVYKSSSTGGHRLAVPVQDLITSEVARMEVSRHLAAHPSASLVDLLRVGTLAALEADKAFRERSGEWIDEWMARNKV